MNDYLDKAKEKLGGAVTGQKERAMATAVRAQLESFCEQDEEFTQAVAQGGSFQACMESVAKGVGSSISDIEAYQRAVAFYFPGAKIRVQMTIDLIGDAAGPEPEKPETKPAGIVLDFAQFL